MTVDGATRRVLLVVNPRSAEASQRLRPTWMSMLSLGKFSAHSSR